MPLITINKGGPAVDIEDGVYPLILTALAGPKTIYPANAGPEGADIFEWTFALDDDAGNREIQDNTSTASGPKSKMYGWITALMGGKPPAVNQTFESTDLVGRRCLGTIGHPNDSAWPKITALMAMPASMLAAGVARATGAPLKDLPVGQAPAVPNGRRTATTPLRDAVAAGAKDDLPF